MVESAVQASEKFTGWLRSCGGRVAITGASGWIGRAMTRLAVDALGPDAASRIRLFASGARSLDLDGQSMCLESLSNADPLGPGEWIVVHLAVAGADVSAEPDALRALNEGMLADALLLAKTGRVRRLVCASSGAVYQAGQGPPEKQAYRALKRDQEQIAHAWSRKTGVPLLMPRIFNVGGPYMTKAHNYALGSFIQQARAGGSIDIGATRPVLRSYVHVLELARVTFDLALAETTSLTFDTAGAEVVEMAGLAEAVGRSLGLPALEIRRPPMQDGPEDRYVGDGSIYRAALGGDPVALDRIIRDTADGLA